MSCCCASPGSGTAEFFDEARAGKELKAYHRKGPGKTTRRLIDGLRKEGAAGSMLDIGTGSGVITLELLKAGATRATGVDLSAGSLRVARAEAERQGMLDRITWHQGDVVELDPSLPVADIVTLDRVVCCYPDYRPLLETATRHCKRWLALSYPRDQAHVHISIWIENLWLKVTGSGFRAFAHPVTAIDGVLRDAGFVARRRDRTLVWESSIYVRGQ